jgi:hypothetical protein
MSMGCRTIDRFLFGTHHCHSHSAAPHCMLAARQPGSHCSQPPPAAATAVRTHSAQCTAPPRGAACAAVALVASRTGHIVRYGVATALRT